MPPKGSKRSQLQFGHSKDMIKEQNRMVLAEVEPTATDREDMIASLESVKHSIENEGIQVVNALQDEYTEVCATLNESGYNVAPYKLEIPEPKQPPTKSPSALSRTPSQDSAKSSRRVHFADSDESSEEEREVQSTGQNHRDQSFTRQRTINYQDEPVKVGASSQQMYDENQSLMEDQDRRLEQIGSSVGRQRVMGENINSELTYHNNSLEDTEAQVDHSQSRLTRSTNGVTNFNRKSRQGGTCSIILVLLLILFLLLIF